MRLCQSLCLLLLVATTALWADMMPAGIVQGTGMVYRAIDGDTVIVNVNEAAVYEGLKGMAPTSRARDRFQDKYQGITIRLANVNTAESKHPDASRNTAAGERAGRVVADWLDGQPVRFACFEFGRYGRLICSIEHKGEDVGLRLIRTGLSPYVTRYGAHPWLHDAYRQAALSGH